MGTYIIKEFPSASKAAALRDAFYFKIGHDQTGRKAYFSVPVCQIIRYTSNRKKITTSKH
jgi:hypothetical protein